MAPAARFVLDKRFNSTLNPVPPIPGIPLPLGLGVDYRKSSLISLARLLDTMIMAFTFFERFSYAVVKTVTCWRWCMNQPGLPR